MLDARGTELAKVQGVALALTRLLRGPLLLDQLPRYSGVSSLKSKSLHVLATVHYTLDLQKAMGLFVTTCSPQGICPCGQL